MPAPPATAVPTAARQALVGAAPPAGRRQPRAKHPGAGWESDRSTPSQRCVVPSRPNNVCRPYQKALEKANKAIPVTLYLALATAVRLSAVLRFRIGPSGAAGSRAIEAMASLTAPTSLNRHYAPFRRTLNVIPVYRATFGRPWEVD